MTSPFEFKGYIGDIKGIGQIYAREIVNPRIVGNDCRRNLTLVQKQDRKYGRLRCGIKVHGYDFIRQAVVVRLKFEAFPEITLDLYLDNDEIKDILKMQQKYAKYNE